MPKRAAGSAALRLNLRSSSAADGRVATADRAVSNIVRESLSVLAQHIWGALYFFALASYPSYSSLLISFSPVSLSDELCFALLHRSSRFSTTGLAPPPDTILSIPSSYPIPSLFP